MCFLGYRSRNKPKSTSISISILIECMDSIRVPQYKLINYDLPTKSIEICLK